MTREIAPYGSWRSPVTSDLITRGAVPIEQIAVDGSDVYFTERRALEGGLWRLERGVEEAEEIAAISDDLLLPQGTEQFLEHHRADGP